MMCATEIWLNESVSDDLVRPETQDYFEHSTAMTGKRHGDVRLCSSMDVMKSVL